MFKQHKALLFLFLFSLPFSEIPAQDSVFLIKGIKDSESIYFNLMNSHAWLFKSGNNPDWALKKINTNDWEHKKPNELNAGQADEKGRIEGWFRIRFSIDSLADKPPLFLTVSSWAAVEIYLDGHLVNAYGKASGDPGSFSRPVRNIEDFQVPVHLETNRTYQLAVHYVNFLPRKLIKLISKNEEYKFGMALTNFRFTNVHEKNLQNSAYEWGPRFFVPGILSLFFWFLFLQNQKEKNLLYIALCTTCGALSAFVHYTLYFPYGIGFNQYIIQFNISLILHSLVYILTLQIVARVFTNLVHPVVKILMAVIFLVNAYFLLHYQPRLELLSALIVLGISIYYLVTYWKKLQGAQWAIVWGLVINGLFIGYFLYQIITSHSTGFVITGIYITFPLALLVYVSMRFHEILHEVKLNAEKLVKVTEEKRQQSLNQQKFLEEEVKRQTADLRKTLDNLKATQDQLIHSEKMASLGELTAGIAHEIQNPLNFVNNFSEINKDLLIELKEQLALGNVGEAIETIEDTIENEDKIGFHGKRADSIVKSMLLHSRTNKGQQEATDLNKLSEEYLRLAYHGMRAKDKSFNVVMETDYAENIDKIKVNPQDMGRVFLNLYNNAFFAVNEKVKKDHSNHYQPKISISTVKKGNWLELCVRDNGNGIPENIMGKIFQPFFTTKPTGEGTGLGLSLTYDIIKAHQGKLQIESKEGDGASFIIQIPYFPAEVPESERTA